MIAVDTNLLIYAHRADTPWHAQADVCIAELAESDDAWAIPWPCLHEFLAIATHPRIYAPPSPLADALEQVECWLESPSLALIGETPDHWQQLRAVLGQSRVTGPMVHDARIAALCTQHGISELWTADRDFGRFKGLKVINPLI